MLEFFSSYPKGYDMTIFHTIYQKSHKLNNGRWKDPVLTLIAKDNVTGKKVKTEIENPEFVYFVANDPEKLTHHYSTFNRKLAHPVQCKYKDLLKSIAENTNNETFFKQTRYSNYEELKKLHTLNQVFMSDMNIEDEYRFFFSHKYKNTYTAPTTGFIDIEVDVVDIAGDFPEPGEAPLSVVTYIFNKKIHTYVYREKLNHLIKEFEDDYTSGKLDKDLKDLVEYAVGGEERVKHFGLDEYKTEIKFFDTEIDLIKAIFNDINIEQPDFVLAWNMAFDIPYIIERVKVLGYNPEEVICHPDFKNKVCYYKVDSKNADGSFKEYAERNDAAFISSYTVYIDQLINFASRRKGQKKYPSYSLNDIGENICGIKKLNYDNITLDIRELPYLDFKTYVFYNIVDVLVQVCIEYETDDIPYIYNSVINNCTRYEKIHRQITYLNNRQIKEYFNQGYLFGNNINIYMPKDNSKFPGAYVADPKLISDRSKLKVDNTPVMLFNNLNDYDFSSLYPSIIREFNLNPETLIGKIYMYNNDNEKVTDQGFTKDFVTNDYLTIANRWMNLPTYDEVYNIIKDLSSSGRMNLKNSFKVYYKGVLKPCENGEFDNKLPALVKHNENNYNTYAVVKNNAMVEDSYKELFSAKGWFN